MDCLHRGHDQLHAQLLHQPVAVRQRLREVVAGVDVQQREGDLARPEGALGQVGHHDGVLAAGEEHNRALELRGRLAQDVDRLGFQLLEVGTEVRDSLDLILGNYSGG